MCCNSRQSGFKAIYEYGKKRKRWRYLNGVMGGIEWEEHYWTHSSESSYLPEHVNRVANGEASVGAVTTDLTVRTDRCWIRGYCSKISDGRNDLDV